MKNFLKLVLPYFYGSEQRYARWAGLWLLLLSQASTAYAFLFIKWNLRFYSALENKDASAFVQESITFILIVIFYFLTWSLMRYYGQQYALRWRMWMTNSALSKWLFDEQRGQLEGSDQRIQEDLMRFTTIFERLFLDTINAVLLIILFIPLLFTQNHGLYLFGISIGWFLLATVVIYTAIGMVVSAKIANPLVQLEYDNQKLEAEFRYNLVHARDGAKLTPGFFSRMLKDITINCGFIYKRQKFFNFWFKGYDQFSFLLPFILLGSYYFSGLISFGMLMQTKSTFSRIRNNMCYLHDHYTELTEMLAISKRLVEFYAAAQIDLTAQQPVKGVEFVPGKAGSVTES